MANRWYQQPGAIEALGMILVFAIIVIIALIVGTLEIIKLINHIP